MCWPTSDSILLVYIYFQTNTHYLFDLVTDMVAELSQVTASKLTADVFSSASISHKMARDYFLFIGTISFHRPVLLEQCKAYGS